MPMNKGITGKTGNAPIKRQGQTATGNYGDDPNMKGQGQKKPRDLRIK